MVSFTLIAFLTFLLAFLGRWPKIETCTNNRFYATEGEPKQNAERKYCMGWHMVTQSSPKANVRAENMKLMANSSLNHKCVTHTKKKKSLCVFKSDAIKCFNVSWLVSAHMAMARNFTAIQMVCILAHIFSCSANNARRIIQWVISHCRGVALAMPKTMTASDLSVAAVVKLS